MLITQKHKEVQQILLLCEGSINTIIVSLRKPPTMFMHSACHSPCTNINYLHVPQMKYLNPTQITLYLIMTGLWSTWGLLDLTRKAIIPKNVLLKTDKTTHHHTSINLSCYTGQNLWVCYSFICSFSHFLRVSIFLWTQRIFFFTLSRAICVALSWDACSLIDSKNNCTCGKNCVKIDSDFFCQYIVYECMSNVVLFEDKVLKSLKIYFTELFWGWKLACGPNDDVSDTKWA